MAVGQIRIVTFDDVLEYMSSHERTTHDKGDLWERVCAWYLRNDPEMQQIVGRVWRWDDTDNPLHTGHDTGIDIVAERTDAPGTYWAVQCKNFDTGHKVSLNDQWGNLVGGMDLIHKVEGASVHVMTNPLITKADGTKFGKSEGGAI